MSAICGIFQLDGEPVARDDIAAMSAALAHRGPDRDGVWSDNGVALGHRLLITTPESLAEHQPILCLQPELVLVADARIDNRSELLGALQLPRGDGLTDSDVILASYKRWGQDCAKRLVGDFAFAIWDARSRALFCARDPMGVRPFYYFRSDRLFAFGSEIKALFTLASVDSVVDTDEIALFIGGSHEDRSRTMYRDVMRLPAAHTMVVTEDGVTLRQYWSADSASDVRYTTDDDYIEGFREIFSSSVSARLRSAHSVGATLSGGLDSSSIVCMARRLKQEGGPLHTFSVVFPGLPERELRLIDERPFVDAVLGLGGLAPHFVRGDELSPLRDARRIVWHLDEPYSAPNLYLHWGMYEAAKQQGVRVVLDGFDGDSAISHGFGRLTGLARANNWDTLEAELLAFSAQHGKSPRRALDTYVLPHLAELAQQRRYVSWVRFAANAARRFGLSRTRLAIEYGVKPTFTSLGSRSRGRRSDAPDLSLLEPGLAARLNRQTVVAQRAELHTAIQSERESHVQGLSQPLYQLTLEIADKSAAAFGVEARYPYFDRRLIEFCLGLPEDQKFGGGWPRLLFRRAMTGILPPMIQWRSTKSNLAPNFHRRFREVDVVADETFNEACLGPYLRLDRLRSLRARYRASETEPMSREALALFRTAVLGMWLKQQSDRSHRARSEAGALSPAAA